MTQPPGPNAIPPAPFPAVPPNHFSQVPIPPNPVWIQPKEPRATTAMVLGIIAVAGGMLCYLPALCGPVALVIGLKSLNAIKANPVWIQPKEPRATTHPAELIRPTVFADSTV